MFASSKPSEDLCWSTLKSARRQCCSVAVARYPTVNVFVRLLLTRSTVGTRVVPDWGSAKVCTFWKFVKNLICFRIFHQQDAPKRVSRYQKWILRKILRFPMTRHVSKLHLGFENHRFPSKSRPQPRIWGLPTKGIT